MNHRRPCVACVATVQQRSIVGCGYERHGAAVPPDVDNPTKPMDLGERPTGYYGPGSRLAPMAWRRSTGMLGSMTKPAAIGARTRLGGSLPARRHRTLALLESLIAVNAVGGMAYALGGASGVPQEWLDKSPFDSYVIPGLYLGVVVGGTCLAAACTTVRHPGHTRVAGLTSAAVTLTRILAQVAVIGYRSPLQPLVAAAGLGLGYLAAHPSP